MSKDVIHTMKLNREPFEDIINGEKNIEIRLNDEKRKQLRVGDTIEFSLISDLDKKIRVKVGGLNKYKSFAELYDNNNTQYFRKWDRVDFINKCYDIYPQENEKKYGTLAIKLNLLNGH